MPGSDSPRVVNTTTYRGAHPRVISNIDKLRVYGLRKMTPEQRVAIRAYFNLDRRGVMPPKGQAMLEPNGMAVNKSLRDNAMRGTEIPSTHARRISLVDEAIAVGGLRFPIPQSMLPRRASTPTLFRGIDRTEIVRWRIGTTRTNYSFMSTSHILARSLMYCRDTLNSSGCASPSPVRRKRKVAVMVLHFDAARPTKAAYSPFEDEFILERGCELQLCGRSSIVCGQQCVYPGVSRDEQIDFTGTTVELLHVLVCAGASSS